MLLECNSLGPGLKRRVELDLLPVVLQRLGLPAHFLPLQRAAAAAIGSVAPTVLPVFIWVCVCVCESGEIQNVIMMKCHHRVGAQ